MVFLETTTSVWRIKPGDKFAVVECPTEFSGEKTAELLCDIEAGGRIKLRFRNAVLVTEPIVSCSVHGDGWWYEVFSTK